MKTIRRTQMESFEGSTLTELKSRFNSVLDYVCRVSTSHEHPIVDLQTLSGYILYETVDRIPEGYKDQLELHNQMVRCAECKKFEPSKYGAGYCPFVKGELRKADEACDRFFSAWEDGDCWLLEGGDRYGKIINEFRCSVLCHEQRAEVG